MIYSSLALSWSKRSPLLAAETLHTPDHLFVKVGNSRFTRGRADVFVISANYWQAANLAAPRGRGSNRTRFLSDLDALVRHKVNNIRIMAGSEGPSHEPYRADPAMMESPGLYNLDVLDGLDFVLSEIAKRNMTATLCLSNYWHWSGGFSQYMNWVTKQPIPYPSSWNGKQWTDAPESEFVAYTSRFYASHEAQRLYRDHLQFIICRENRYTQRLYKDDPAIFAWELANEPQDPSRDWIVATSQYIKSLDANHLVTAGMESKKDWDDFELVHAVETIDYTTIHIWAQNRGVYNMSDPSEQNIAAAVDWGLGWVDAGNEWTSRLGKPIVLEEFGFPRDNWVDPSHPYASTNPTTRRDRYFAALIQRVGQLSGDQGFY
ncbi:hypothetical protein HDU91_005263, partial [Kappamyces sp. JEL0680]